MLLQGKLALVTGGGSGIGEGIARAMAQQGARVIVADVNVEGAARVAASIGGDRVHYALDVADRAACDVLAKTIRADIGPVSVLVNNAGIIRRGKLESASVRADWDATLAVNLDGPFNMVTAFLEQLKATQGSIINIGSIQSFVALPNSAAYTTSKGGVRAFTKALAIELSPQGVRVNAIGPGMIATAINADARQNPDYMKSFAGRIPLGRLGEPADIAGPAVFLASDLARYVTGVTLPVDGGFLAY
ncbi:MAG TPA: SDR family oxidoreductase [Rhodopila sp.]|nr:SDR family oxidoreductase [Rhodopila sp.]